MRIRIIAACVVLAAYVSFGQTGGAGGAARKAEPEGVKRFALSGETAPAKLKVTTTVRILMVHLYGSQHVVLVTKVHSSLPLTAT